MEATPQVVPLLLITHQVQNRGLKRHMKGFCKPSFEAASTATKVFPFLRGVFSDGHRPHRISQLSCLPLCCPSPAQLPDADGVPSGSIEGGASGVESNLVDLVLPLHTGHRAGGCPSTCIPRDHLARRPRGGRMGGERMIRDQLRACEAPPRNPKKLLALSWSHTGNGPAAVWPPWDQQNLHLPEQCFPLSICCRGSPQIPFQDLPKPPCFLQL